MKLSVFFIIASTLNIFAIDSYSQAKKVSVDAEQSTVLQVLNAIEQQTDYYFLYSTKLVDVSREVSVNYQDTPLNNVLAAVFEGTDVDYVILERQIVLSNRELLGKPEANVIVQQGWTVTGKVTDEEGNPLLGVSVVVEGTTTGTITNMEGGYEIQVPGSDARLEFSFVGMLRQVVPVGDQTLINVTLQPDIIGMEEVVVIGYGTQKKSDVVSSVVSVEVDDVVKVPSSDIGEMLRGKATGVQVTTADASPGSSSNILIRGRRSITGGNAPLVIVDGVQVVDINDVSPYDIASMEILKDAAAQAIYGARASNGVILITTKRGQEGKTQVKYSGYYGVQTVQKHFVTYSGDEFVDYKREAFRAANGGVFLPDDQVFSAEELQTIASRDYINWEEKILQIAPITNHNISVATGTANTKVYTSFNYFSQEGIVKGSDYDRGTIRLNIDQTITDWLKVGVNTSWQISQKDNPGATADQGNMLVRSITTSPLGQVYDADGNLKIHPSGVQDSFNPLLDLNEITDDTRARQDIENVFLDITPIKGLNYRFNVSRTSSYNKNYSFSSSKSLPGILNGGLGEGFVGYFENTNWQLENILNYEPDLGDEHQLGVTFVQSWLNRNSSMFSNTSSDIPSDVIGIYYLSAAGGNQPSISASERNLLSYVARVQYNYAGRYYLSASMRADGSSVFGENNKWGYFPAVALGWNVNREAFLTDIDVINVLKLRASYGSVGNEGIQPYQSLTLVNSYDYLFNGIKAPGLLPGGILPNPSLKWETTTSFNLAIDYGFIQNRLNGTFEFYNTRTNDLLNSLSIPNVTGYSTSQVNVGEIENKGIELSLNGDIIRKSDFNLSAGIMFNRNRNEIIHLFGLDEDNDGIEDDVISRRWFIGYPIDVYYDYKYVGIFSTAEEIANSNTPNAEPGDIQVWDRDPNDGELNPDDRVITDATPDWYGTFNLSMEYKGFDLSGSIYTVQGLTKFNSFLVDYFTGGNPRGILSGIKQDYWTPEHTSGTRARPIESRGRRFMDQGNVTAGLQDASFIRLQNLTIGYSFPQSVLNKLGINELRIYFTGQNLFTITDFESFSPENEPSSYPETISVIGGIQFGF